MNTWRLKNWSQRQQVLAVILMAGAVLFALWFFLLTPLNRRRARLEREIQNMRSQLASKNYLLGENVLREKSREAQKHNADLRKEWERMRSHLTVFTNQTGLAESDIGHIDYKVALYDVRRRLLQKSRDLKISLPHDLGLDEAVRSNEDARKLMLQLRSVEKLVDLALDLKIDMLRDVMPLPPALHAAGEQNETFLEEYPVRIGFFGSLDNLYRLFHAVLQPGRTFALRHLRVETASRNRPGLLDVRAELSTFVFLKDPEEMNLAARKPAAPGRPMGH